MGQVQPKPSYIPKPRRDEREYLESMGFIIGPGKGYKFVKLTLPDGYEWKDRSCHLATNKWEPRWYIVDPDGKIVAEYHIVYCGEGLQPDKWVDGCYDPNYLKKELPDGPCQNPNNLEEANGPMFRSKFGEVIRIKQVYKLWDLMGWL